MIVRPDPRASTPVSEQIATSIRALLASGKLSQGMRMPSVRGFAAEILVNPNTVAKVYRELEREGLLKAKPGSGVKVTPEAEKLARHRVLVDLKTSLKDWLRQADEAGLSHDIIMEMLEQRECLK